MGEEEDGDARFGSSSEKALGSKVTDNTLSKQRSSVSVSGLAKNSLIRI